MVTIKDVAKAAGVPEKTVMRALAGKIMGKRRDARERAERVRKAAEELGYVPSGLASSLRRGKTRTIGLLTGYITNRFFASLTETVMDECEKYGYHVRLELTRQKSDKTLECLADLRRARVDGIFYATPCFPEVREELERIQRSGMPVIFPVGRDCSGAFKTVFAELKEKGCRHITFAPWHAYPGEIIQEESICRELCAEYGFDFSVFPLYSLGDAEKLAELHPETLICTAPHFVRHFCKVKDADCRTAIVGIYDEWNVVDHPGELTGILLAQSEEAVRCAVRNLIAAAEGEENAPPGLFPVTYYPQKDFHKIVLKDLFAKHLQNE
ncbi:MAG: LacI family DNA-binding transcriptional regulator [Lentisphaeria bacterium]|nr:LacI family DNA-binding transcriptional regulator [Lentisphaeria bacterium]